MVLDELNARTILDAAHAAWSNGDVDAMLHYFDADVIYWCNAGGPRPRPLTIAGKPLLRNFLESVASVADGVCVSEYFRLIGGVGRAKVEGYIRHKNTGLTLATSYRQVVTFRDHKILRLEEYHDAAKTVSFWRHIVGECVVATKPCADTSDNAPREERLDGVG